MPRTNRSCLCLAPERPLSSLSKLLALGCAGLLAACTAEQGAPEELQGGFRHVILISLDTTRADHLGCYGSPRVKTPAIDRVAAEGVRFDQVLSPAPTTLVAHTSLFTGSYPQTHGVVRNGFMVNPENVMLPEILGPAGFHTAAVLGSFALEHRFGFDQGFMSFDEDFALMLGSEDDGVDQDQRSAELVTDAALKYVDSALEAPHIFLFAHYFDAHAPYDPPDPYKQRYRPAGQPAEWHVSKLNESVELHHARLIDQPKGRGGVIFAGMPPELILTSDGLIGPRDQELADLYAGEVSYLDEHLGRLLNGLEDRGILEEALVIITGDHGETFWEHGDFWNHGLMTYGTTVNVPLILRFPDGRGAGRVVQEPVSTIDLVPTLCELLGVPIPPLVDGKSLLPALEGKSFSRGSIFSQATQPGPRFEPKDTRTKWGNWSKNRCVRSGRWKYSVTPYLKLEQLFDLENDPGEQHDLLHAPGWIAGTAPGLAEQAKEALDLLRGEMQAWAQRAPGLPSTFNREQLDETMRRLKGLGYSGK